MLPPGFEPGWPARKALKYISCLQVNDTQLQEFLALREIEGLSNGWLKDIKGFVTDYLDYINWKIRKDKTLEYLKKIKNKYSTTSYRKQVYQIRKFLTYLSIDWAKDIKPPPELEYTPKRITRTDIKDTIRYFKGHRFSKQFKAIILLGASSGMRAEEIYQLNPEDIDIEERIVHVNHDPRKGQTTKTKKSRISFFNPETQETLSDYLEFFNEESSLKCLFSKTHIERAFSKAPIRVKELRKFFSQEWDRLGGPTTIKKIIMGHSLRGDVDLMHYNCQSIDDLKAIYDRVGIKILN